VTFARRCGYQDLWKGNSVNHKVAEKHISVDREGGTASGENAAHDLEGNAGSRPPNQRGKKLLRSDELKGARVQLCEKAKG